MNQENNEMLGRSLQAVNDMIEIMTVIIDKFKDYKKHIYDTHILKNIVTITNKIIKQLCHEDTKQFELDYLLSEMKDSLHINWLIKNVVKDDTDNKQIISIHQASGFQKFAISTALRMTLFNNNSCSQLFIDEGFTACDKLNLSIVPSFLTRLLNIYNSVIIVSHIDIIQDSVENRVAIKYNDDTKSSAMHFGSYKKPATQRKQKIQ
jgi:DNA repair exonuclease SbcCD ATPase subunit